jgi:immune inhibitor A
MPIRPDLLDRLQREVGLDEAREILALGLPAPDIPRAAALPGSIKALVLLVDFDDVPADTIMNSRGHFREMLFDADNEYSMRSFYRWTSYGKLDITGEVFGWFRVPEQLSYYANDRRGMGYYPKNTQRMIEDAIDVADSVVDFSEFDNDGPDGIPNSGDDDGFVDILMVVHGGQGYEWTMNPAHIHSHAGRITVRQVDGVSVEFYATEPENGKVGTFAHELGHLFGLPDLYDVTLNTYGLGAWSLMSYGSWGGGDGSRPVGLDPWCKIQLGFVDPVEIDANIPGYNLPCIEDSAHVMKLWSEAEAGPQYFLVENRVAKSWDSYLSLFGDGLLVYHVDERQKDNSSDSKHLISLEQADGEFDLEQRRTFGFGSDGGDPYPGTSGNREFGWWTIPSNYSNEANPTQVTLTNISDASDMMTMDVEVQTPVILLVEYDVDDTAGDGDGRPEPGEDIILGVRFRNYGIRCHDVAVTLSTEDPYAGIQQSQAFLDLILKNGFSPVLGFPVSLDEDVLEPYEIAFDVDIEGEHAHGVYSGSDRFVLAVPLRTLEGWPRYAGDAITTPLAVADLDDDGLKEIIAGCKNGLVYVWDHSGYQLDGWPVNVGSAVPSKAAVCDVDLDGSPEIVTCGLNGSVYVLNNDGSACPGWPQHTEGEILSSPLLADIDDDGMVEIVCGSTDGKMYAWNEDGHKVRGWPSELGGHEIWMSPGAADIDGDHLSEVVVGGYGGPLYVIDGNGSILDGWPVLVGRGCGRGAPSVADFDGDGLLEIAISGLFSNSVYLVALDGRVQSGWPRWSYNCDELTSPVAADIDNDGLPEIAVSTTCGTIAAWNADGSLCKAISADAPDPVQHCEPVFVDLDGNGRIEGLIGTTSSVQSQVYAFGKSGKLVGFPIDVNGGVWSTPVLDDIDADGNAEIVVATTAGEVHVWRFIGAKGTGRVEYSQSRGDIWNTGYYGFSPSDNIPLPDLAMSDGDISIDPLKPRQGEAITISARVMNSGHATAEDFTVSAFHDEVVDSCLIGSYTIAAMHAKTDTVLTFEWGTPGGQPTRLVYIRLDDDNSVLERFELNNQSSKRFYLSLCDLGVEIMDVDPFPVEIGSPLTMHVTLRNTGEDVARDFALAFYDSVVDESRCFASYPIDSLAPGEMLEFQANHTIDAFWGDYVRLWVAADPTKDVLEYYLSNNTKGMDLNSGIDGRLVVTPHEIGMRALRSSRTCYVVESPACNCLFASSTKHPYPILFEVSGSDIDLSRNTIVFGSGGDIAGFDLRDSVLFVVSTNSDYEYQPSVWGDDIVWLSDTADSTSLFLRRSSGAVKTIRRAGVGNLRYPTVSSTMVVWEETHGDGYDVMAYDLERDSVLVISAEEGDQTAPSAWGEIVVWEDRSTDGGDIAGMDLATGSRLEIVSAEGLQLKPVVHGDIVVWQDSRAGNWDIYGYSIGEDREFPISRQRHDQVLPSLSDSTVFWIDKRGANDRIRGLRFGGDRRVVSVRGFDALWQDGQIKLLAEVDEYDDGITYRIYRYPDDRPMPEDRIDHLRHEFTLAGDSLHAFTDTMVAVQRSFYYTLGIIDGYGVEAFHGPIEGRAYERSPVGFVIGVPHPNPFTHSVTLAFGLPRKIARAPGTSWPDPAVETSHVEMSVYSVDGRRIRTITNRRLAPGYYHLTWDGRNDRGEPVSSGVYFITASADGYVTSRKIILVR